MSSKTLKSICKSECAKLGSQRSREVSADIKNKNINKYNKHPKHCKKCDKILEYNKRRNDFCSQSCAASFNNIGVRRHGNPKRNCLYCGKIINAGAMNFCSISHGRLYRIENKIRHGEYLSNKAIRYYVIGLRGHKCEECKLETWRGQPIPLDMHHIDGDRHNNKLSNLKLECKNCHGLTDSYADKKGNT